MQYFLYDENYIFIEEIYLSDFQTDKIPENATTVQPQGFYKAKFDPVTQTWFESATQEEIDAVLQGGENREL